MGKKFMTALAICLLLGGCGSKSIIETAVNCTSEQAKVIEKTLSDNGIKPKSITAVSVNTDSDDSSFLAALLTSYAPYDIESSDGKKYRMTIKADDGTVFSIVDSETQEFVYGNVGGLFGNSAEEDEGDVASELKKISSEFVTGYWNDVFCNITFYVGRGTDSVGGELDLEYTLRKLDNYEQERDEYNAYVESLADDQYSEIKYIWGKLISEMDNMYNRIVEEEPRASDPTYEFNTGSFSTYSKDFSKEIKNLK